MSRRSRTTTGESIVPGQAIVSTISTRLKDGVAANLLLSIGRSRSGERIVREFPEQWDDQGGVLVKEGRVRFSGNADRVWPLTIKIGVEDGTGLILRQTTGSQFSLRPQNGEMVLPIGETYGLHGGQPIAGRIDSVATLVVGTWVIHGQDWMNRAKEVMHRPYGNERKHEFLTVSFEVIDGATQPAVTLRQLIEMGCERSTHVGEWLGRHSTIIPALCDMPINLHEFREKGGDDICRFNGVLIGSNAQLWGPYCGWNEAVRYSGELGLWQDLAKRCSSPFAFHLHATRTMFPKARLDSSRILETVGEDRFRVILETMMAREPERFYRLIDINGYTHRLTAVGPKTLEYGKFNFPRKDVVENVLTTFRELRDVELDPRARVDQAMQRVVIDTHAYLVLEALMGGRPINYQLSGRDMHKYLTEGADSKMHRVRNERLFLLLRDFFGVQTMKLVVCPPLPWNSGLTSQYDLNRIGFRKDDWLDKVVTA